MDMTERKFELLDAVSDLFRDTEDVDRLLQKIGTLASKLVRAEGSSILIFNEDRSHLYFKVSRGKTAPILRRIPVSDGVAWWVAQNGRPALVNDVEADPRFTGTIDRITGFKTKNLICVPIKLEGKVIGVLEAVNKLEGEGFTKEDLQLLTMLSGQAAIALRNAERMEEYRNFFSNSIELFVKSIETIGVMTNMMFPGHCWRVAEISTFIGQMMDVEGDELNTLYYGAVLHDIGLLEYRELGSWEFGGSEDPWEEAKQHPVWGANIVKEIKMLNSASPIIRHHHENFDGTGYPDGLRGEEIPLGARIVSVAERYEELLLKAPMSCGGRSEVVERIKGMAGRELDPKIVEIFVSEVLRGR